MNDVLNIYSTFCLHRIYLVTEKPHAGPTTHQNELICGQMIKSLSYTAFHKVYNVSPNSTTHKTL